MFCLSLGYFLADLLLVLVDVLVRGKFPHLWAGRLVSAGRARAVPIE